MILPMRSSNSNSDAKYLIESLVMLLPFTWQIVWSFLCIFSLFDFAGCVIIVTLHNVALCMWSNGKCLKHSWSVLLGQGYPCSLLTLAIYRYSKWMLQNWDCLWQISDVQPQTLKYKSWGIYCNKHKTNLFFNNNSTLVNLWQVECCIPLVFSLCFYSRFWIASTL